MVGLTVDGKELTAELWNQRPKEPFSMAPAVLRLSAPGQPQPLAAAELNMNQARKLELADMTGTGQPFLVVHGRMEAVSDHTAVAQVFRFENGSLTPVFEARAWYGSTDLDGTALVAFERWQPAYEPRYLVKTVLFTKPRPRPYRTQRFGWKDGQFQLLSEEVTRLGYPLYGKRPFEKPLPPEAVTFHQQGLKGLAEGRMEEAIASLQKAVEVASDFPDAWNDLAHTYILQQNWEAAFQAASAAVDWNPWHPYAQFNLGLAAFHLEKGEEVLEAFYVATALQEGRWETHYLLGQALEREQDRLGAAAEYKRALELAPGQLEVEAALQRVTP